MSRIAKAPVVVPKGVEIKISGNMVSVKGAMGQLEHAVHAGVAVEFTDGEIRCTLEEQRKGGTAIVGTTRALLANMVKGVSAGFEKKLQLVGIGYRGQVKGKSLNLTLGFSHPIDFTPPDGVTIEAPSQTEIVVKGIDKQQVGQVAAVIRGFRPPEPYKGKGVKYADELVVRKEAKKK